jgi:hypothetical protein
VDNAVIDNFCCWSMDYFTVATLQNQDKFMNLGKGWIIIEEHFHTQESFLISIVNARKGSKLIYETFA